MKKKITLSTAITLIILTAALMVSVTMLIAMRYFNNQVQSVSQRQAMYTHVNDVDKKVREYYTDLDEEVLRQALTKGYVDGIGDPYAAYFSPDAYAAEQLKNSGFTNTVGVGLCADAEGNVVVCRVNADSSAAKAGVQVGDKVTAVNDVPVTEKRWEAWQQELDAATAVLLSVQRGESALAFELSAYQYAIRSVQSEMIRDDVAYIKVTAFYDNTPNQFRSTVSAMLEKGVSGIVFDLRNNPGGSSEAVQDMLSYLLPVGAYGTATDTKGVTTKLTATVNGQLSVPTATLVNNATAGEAELFAGVLQEFGLTSVIGEKTAGKAKYQVYFALESDNSAMKLTTGEYALLKGGSWQGTGVTLAREVILADDLKASFALLKPTDDPQVAAGVSQIVATENVPVKTTAAPTAPTTVPTEPTAPAETPTETTAETTGTTTGQ